MHIIALPGADEVRPLSVASIMKNPFRGSIAFSDGKAYCRTTILASVNHKMLGSYADVRPPSILRSVPVMCGASPLRAKATKAASSSGMVTSPIGMLRLPRSI